MEKENVKISVIREGYRSLAKEVREASHGGRVLLYTEEGMAGDDAAAAISFEGMAVTRRNIPEKGADELFAELQKPPEGIMAAVAVGGVTPIEAAKAARLPSAIPKILFPTQSAALSAADDRSYLSTKGSLPVGRSMGHVTLLDPALLAASPLRPLLGYIAATLLEEADEAYEKLLLEKESPAQALRTLKEKAALLTDVREENASADAVNAALTLLKLSPSATGVGSAHTLSLLAAKCKAGSFPDYLFPAAYALLILYQGYLGALPLEHCPPPDRAENLRLLGAKCGMEPSLLSPSQKPYAEGYDDRWRLTAEYREDFLEALRAIPLSHLSRLYRRAAKEDASPALTASELLTLLSLTGEAISGYPLIKHIKMTGLIEPFLKCG